MIGPAGEPFARTDSAKVHPHDADAAVVEFGGDPHHVPAVGTAGKTVDEQGGRIGGSPVFRAVFVENEQVAVIEQNAMLPGVVKGVRPGGEVGDDCLGVAVAQQFRRLKVGEIANHGVQASAAHDGPFRDEFAPFERRLIDDDGPRRLAMSAGSMRRDRRNSSLHNPPQPVVRPEDRESLM